MLYDYADITDTSNLPAKLSELKWHITGFIDGDGSFPVVLSPVPEKRFGWLIQPRFQVELRDTSDSVTILKITQKTIGTNATILHGNNFLKLVVTNRRLLLEKVIPFFTKYKPALKRDDFATMKFVCEALESKKHLTQEGFRQVIREISSQPTDGETGRKWSYNDLIKDEEPPATKKPSAPSFPDGVDLRHYLAGFIDAEGTLGYAIGSQTKTVTPYLTITHQNTAVLRKLQQVMQCGNISTGRLQIYGMENTLQKLIPFLDRHKLIARRTAYRKFKIVLKLLIEQEHKKHFEEVVQRIRSINERGILRDHTLGTYPEMEGEDMAQHQKNVA
jgi:LAGLIDADG endonuclease